MASLRRVYDRVLEAIAVLMIAAVTVIVVLGFTFRWIGLALVWYDEVASISLAWLTYFGAALAALRGSHLGFAGFVNSLPANWRVLATLVNYACHPTTLAFENTLVSPDYPGAMRELIERETGAPCIFLQGASGDLGPREGFVGDVAVADRNGRQLGFAALAALEALPPAGTRFEYAGPVISGATLGIWKHVPVDAATKARHATWRLERWRTNSASSSSPVSPSHRPISRSTSAAERAGGSTASTARSSTVRPASTLTRTGCVGSRLRAWMASSRGSGWLTL